MTSVHDFDLQRLLVAISDDQPCGSDLREASDDNSIYYRLKNARYEAQTVERQRHFHDSEKPPARPDWDQVARLALEILENVSKDLEVCAYLIEAWVRLRGFLGLRDGFELVRELVVRYWEQLYPHADDEQDPSGRLTHLAGLNGLYQDGTLIRPIMSLPLTADTSVGQFCCADILQSRQLATVSEKDREYRLSHGDVAIETTSQAALETTPEVFAELSHDIAAAQEALEMMTAELRAKAGQATLSLPRIREALEACADVVRHYSTQSESPVGGPAAQQNSATPLPSSFGDNITPPLGLVRTREEALAMLEQVSQFYRRTEPHSPMSWATRQLIRWGKMPLTDLVAELIPDEVSRNFFRMRTGMD